MNTWWQREKYIITHGQTRSFRIKKWIVIGIISLGIYALYGWMGIMWWATGMCVVGISLHFLLRSMTHGWTKPWGPVKQRIKTPFD